MIQRKPQESIEWRYAQRLARGAYDVETGAGMPGISDEEWGYKGDLRHSKERVGMRRWQAARTELEGREGIQNERGGFGDGQGTGTHHIVRGIEQAETTVRSATHPDSVQVISVQREDSRTMTYREDGRSSCLDDLSSPALTLIHCKCECAWHGSQ